MNATETKTIGARAPVFVVGAPRSGTTMLAAMLASHRSFSAGPETQFFSKLPPDALDKAARDTRWPDMATRLLASLTLAGQPVIELFEHTRESLHADLASRPPAIASMLESLTAHFAASRGKPRWVEKTPNHILNLETIREIWPEARIIRIVRDPRDVGMSTCRLPTFSDRPLANIYVWLRWQLAAEEFFATDSLSMTVRYESIVDDAERELAGVCAFLREDFDPAMIEFATSAQDVSSNAETWKQSVATRLNASRKFAWKSTMPEDIRLVSNLLCQEYLQRFDYEFEPAASVTRTGYRMARGGVERNEAWLIAQAQRNIRWLPSDSPHEADRIFDQPEYRRFRDPRMILRYCASRVRSSLSGKAG